MIEYCPQKDTLVTPKWWTADPFYQLLLVMIEYCPPGIEMMDVHPYSNDRILSPLLNAFMLGQLILETSIKLLERPSMTDNP